EWATNLVLRVRLLSQQHGRQGAALRVRRGARGRAGAVIRQAAAMRRVDADCRRDGARVGLSLGDTSPRLHVGIERDGDSGENTDDRHNDQKLDKREAALSADHGLPELHHGTTPPKPWLATLLLGGWQCRGNARLRERTPTREIKYLC